MKRTTIIIISLVIGISFFGLLLLQGRIVKAMVKMLLQNLNNLKHPKVLA